MKQIQFDHLSLKDQQQITWEYGFVIGLRKDDKYTYVKYSLSNFLVELKYEGGCLKNTNSFTWQELTEKQSYDTTVNTCTLTRPPYKIHYN